MRALLCCAITAAACGAAPAQPDAGDTFIAFTTTFADFRTWPSFHSDGPPDDGTLPADTLGPRTQYVNHLPPHGATAFPVGTIIVEVRESNGNKIFAAVKRGGGYNPTGAHDWEWFELSEQFGAPTIVWRGVGPPAGEIYGGDPNGGCNACHAQRCGANDYVCAAALQLGGF